MKTHRSVKSRRSQTPETRFVPAQDDWTCIPLCLSTALGLLLFAVPLVLLAVSMPVLAPVAGLIGFLMWGIANAN